MCSKSDLFKGSGELFSPCDGSSDVSPRMRPQSHPYLKLTHIVNERDGNKETLKEGERKREQRVTQGSKTDTKIYKDRMRLVLY